MKNFIKKSFSEPYKKTTLILFGVFGIFFIASLIVGVSDNPPGIALCYIGWIAFILAFIHHMRSAKSYFKLLIFSLLGFVLFAVLHNVVYGIGKIAENIAIIPQVCEWIHVMFFLMALFIFPPGVLIGLIGSIIFLFKTVNAE